MYGMFCFSNRDCLNTEMHSWLKFMLSSYSQEVKTKKVSLCPDSLVWNRFLPWIKQAIFLTNILLGESIPCWSHQLERGSPTSPGPTSREADEIPVASTHAYNTHVHIHTDRHADGHTDRSHERGAHGLSPLRLLPGQGASSATGNIYGYI